MNAEKLYAEEMYRSLTESAEQAFQDHLWYQGLKSCFRKIADCYPKSEAEQVASQGLSIREDLRKTLNDFEYFLVRGLSFTEEQERDLELRRDRLANILEFNYPSGKSTQAIFDGTLVSTDI